MRSRVRKTTPSLVSAGGVATLQRTRPTILPPTLLARADEVIE
jgi:hypothetical protein